MFGMLRQRNVELCPKRSDNIGVMAPNWLFEYNFILIHENAIMSLTKGLVTH